MVPPHCLPLDWSIGGRSITAWSVSGSRNTGARSSAPAIARAHWVRTHFSQRPQLVSMSSRQHTFNRESAKSEDAIAFTLFVRVTSMPSR